MTEYTILVGLIGILLVSVVERYKTQIEVTIIGTAEATGGVANNIDTNSNKPSSTKPPKKVPATAGEPGAYQDPPGSGNYFKNQ